MTAIPVLPEDHPWVTHGELPTPQHLVEVMASQGWEWDEDAYRFHPVRGGPAEGRVALNVEGALGYLDAEWIDQSGDIRKLPPPAWPSWFR